MNADNIVEQLKKIKNIDIAECEVLEIKAFTTIDGDLLDTISGLRREYMKIDTMFTFDSGEELNFIQFNNIRSLIEILSNAIEDEHNYDAEFLKRLIVLLDLYLGIEVSYYQTMYELIKESKIELGINVIQEYKFEDIYDLIKVENDHKYRR